MQNLPPDKASFESHRSAVNSVCREPQASDPQYEDWEPRASNQYFTVSLSYTNKKLNMNHAPINRPKFDPYDQAYGKEMYLSDISDSDGESKVISISKGR